MTSRFRLTGNSFVATYPHRDGITHERLLRNIKDKVGFKYDGSVIGYEETDSYKHWHVFFKTRGRFETRDERRFDVDGVHGDYRSVKAVGDALEYVVKSGCFIEDGMRWADLIISSIKSPLERFVRMCKVGRFLNKEEANEFIGAKGDVKTYLDAIVRPKVYQRVIDDFFPRSINEFDVRVSRKILRTIKRWIASGYASLFITGPTGIGKTAAITRMFGRSLLLVRHRDALKRLTDEHRVVLYDDMSFTHWDGSMVINLLDPHASQIDVKGAMVEIPSEVFKVFTSNHEWRDVFLNKWTSKEHEAAIERRLEIVRVTKEDFVLEKKKRGFVSLDDEVVIGMLEAMKRSLKKKSV